MVETLSPEQDGDAGDGDADLLKARQPLEQIIDRRGTTAGCDADAGWVPAPLLCQAADLLNVLGELVETRARDGDPTITKSRHATQRSGAAAANPDRRMRLLHWLWEEGCVDELEVAPVEGDLLLRPQRTQETDILVGTLAAFTKGDPEQIEFFLQPARCDAKQEAASRQHVEARQLLRQHQRVAIRQDEHGRPQSDP